MSSSQSLYTPAQVLLLQDRIRSRDPVYCNRDLLTLLDIFHIPVADELHPDLPLYDQIACWLALVPPERTAKQEKLALLKYKEWKTISHITLSEQDVTRIEGQGFPPELVQAMQINHGLEQIALHALFGLTSALKKNDSFRDRKK